jgi:predicted nucleic acid-binding protein
MMVFVDTVALLALWDVRDQWHEQAEAAFIRAFSEGWTLVSSEPVLLECGNAASRKSFRDAVVTFRQALMEEGRLFEPTADEVGRAWTAYAKRVVANAGIVDLISFELMHRAGITHALTNDEHFRVAGFETVM